MGFATEFVWDMPTTSPRLFTRPAAASGPPSVPKSRLCPFSHRKARVCVELEDPRKTPILWRRGKMIDLGNFGGNFTGIAQINNRGQVIGTSNLPGDEFNDPFLWEDGKLIDLYASSVGGNPYTVNAINDAGQLVGAFPDHPVDAYVWKKGVATDLGFLDGDCYSEAFVIGSKGQIAGQSYSCDFSSARPFIWQDGMMFDLNEVTQTPSGFRFTQAFVINDRGEIGGIGTPPGCDFDEDCGHAMVLIPCSGRFHDRDCDERAMFAVRGIETPLKRIRQVSGAGLSRPESLRRGFRRNTEEREDSSLRYAKNRFFVN